MRTFKLKTGVNEIYNIERDIFESETFKKKPYYSNNSKGEVVQFAVCPQCDNPIEIIGLYKKLKNINYPYGKHYPHSIEGLAVYNQQMYEFCPYANANKNITAKDRKRNFGEYEKKVYNVIKKNFDKIIYILSKELDIKITLGTAEKMLKDFVKSEGFLYPWLTLSNAPWVIGYLTSAKSLYAQPILQNSELHNAIEKNCPSVKLIQSEHYKNYDVLLNKDNKFAKVEYCLMKHNRKVENDRLFETMQMVVRDTSDGEKRFYSKILNIDEKYFIRLINSPNAEKYKNKMLLDIAKENMPVI